MKLLNCLLGVFIVFGLTLVLGCGTDTPLDATIEFHPEYDYMTGYDVFPNGFSYAASAIDDGNVNFSPSDSDTDIPPTFLGDMDNVKEFINEWSECLEVDENGNCKKNQYGYELLYHGAYLAAIQDLMEKPDPQQLGITILGGWKYNTSSIIFVRFNRDVSESWPFDGSQFVQATVVHELGHAVGALTHLCIGTNTNSDYHDLRTCVMSSTLPWPECAQEGDQAVIEYGPWFCNKCSSNLKKVVW